MRWIPFMLVLVLSSDSLVLGQENETAKNYGNQITPLDLKEYLSIIASDALEGRKTGTRGQKMAAAFIADFYREIGLTPPVNGGYYQPFELYSSSVENAYVKTGESRYDNYGDITYFGSEETVGEVLQDIVFVGRGREEDYKQVDVSNKAVVVLIPVLKGPLSATFRSLSQTARDKGAAMVFILTEGTPEDYRSMADRIRAYTSSGRLSLKKPGSESSSGGVFVINQPVAEKIFNTSLDKLKKACDDPGKKSLKKIKPGKIAYRVIIHLNTLKTENVLGFLEGGDKKEEVIAVTAHYDHIGTTATGEDHINNGADDDGSGTVSVLEIARNFAKAKKEGHGPRRSMLFMTVVAEEQGLLGSEYYTAHPVFPLANTVVDLNIDMIGRVDPEHKDSTHYVYVIGSDRLSTELHQLSEKTNATYTKLKFDYTYNDENHPTNLYKRSDHWNFAKNGIPIIFYFDGIHEDYHRPSDEVARIDFDLLAVRAQCVFYTAWEIANREGRIVVDNK
jgi:hypothetical protein